MSLLKQSPCCLPPRKNVALLLLMVVSSLIGPSNSSLCHPEPKQGACAACLEAAEVTGKLTAWVDHMDSAVQQRLDEAFIIIIMIYVHIYHTMASNGINEYALIYCRS